LSQNGDEFDIARQYADFARNFLAFLGSVIAS
jgi:hypothetical protein